MIINEAHSELINSSNSRIKARVVIDNGSNTPIVCNCGEALSSFSVDRMGEGKFFGFGVSHKLTALIIDLERAINVKKGDRIELAYGEDDNLLYPYPDFTVDEPTRNENTNEITVTAYDALYAKAAEHTVSELNLTSYTVREFAAACATLLGLSGIVIENVNDTSFDTEYAVGANFDGSELIRAALNAIAEVTQTIYYINSDSKLVFKRLDISGDPVLTITKDNYMTLRSSTAHTLTDICETTELGDNVSTESGEGGAIQYVRDNPFWELREDIATLLDNALAAVGGLTISQIEGDWFGNYLLEIGDKIAFVAEDNSLITTYLLNDLLSYDGAIGELTSWEYGADSAETEANPTSLGAILNQTVAKVDKANKLIELSVSQSEANAASIAALRIQSDNIAADVKSVGETLDSTNEAVGTLTKEVNAKLNADEFSIKFTETLEQVGVDKVVTSTGYTFDGDGLKITKTDSEISTTISEDGMVIQREGTDVLVADNQGVRAEDLHATTYLIIGTNSRFEDYTRNGEPRTGCFWIGE